jgi:DNA helicase II / ATP-dependent DNA helicase PcrA
LPDKYSFSQIEAFSNCPLQYKFNFLLKIPVLPKAPLVFGRTMHNTVRDFMLLSGSQVKVQAGLFADGKENTSSAHKTLADLEIIYKKNWQEEGFASKEEEANYKKKGWQSLKIFFEQLENNGYPDILYLEKSFFIKIGDYIFKGMIDRVDKLPDGSLEIIDYKTGSVPKEFNFDKKKQLLLYQVALEEGLGLKVSKLSYYYFEGGQKKSFTAQPEDMDKLKQGVLSTIGEIEKCVFMPKPSLLCGFCDFRGICEFREK